jgi:hypothetical protein
VTGTLVEFRDAPLRWWRGLSLASTDAWLYAVAAAFALGMGLWSRQPAQWHWGFLAVGPFALGAVLVVCGSSLGRIAQRRWRVAVLSLVAIGVIAVPLVYETTLHPLAQPEVSNIERAGQRIVADETVYPSYVNAAGHLVNPVPGISPSASLFPYGPTMGAFGIPAAITDSTTGMSDARVTMTLFTFLLMALALCLLRAPPDRKLRTAQVLLVLPSGSLFLATGGDDMPVLALCLLALVALQRRSVAWMAILLALACTMKLTAWPFARALIAISRDEDGRFTGRRVAAVTAGLVAATFAPFVLVGPRGFVANVFEFPLGLAGVSSPAASALPGHVLTDWQPWLSHVIMPAVFVFGAVVLYRFWRTRWPVAPTLALRTLAIGMTVIICAATATRVGYLIYPLNFMVWAWVLSPVPAPSVDRVVLVEAQSPTG